MSERAAALIIREGLLLLVHRMKPDDEYHVLPGGGVEPGESPEAACVREAKEETGFDIIVRRPVCRLSNRGRTEHYFLASVVGGELGLGGPERERQSETDQYCLEWVGPERLATIDLRPAEVRELCLASLRGD